MYIPTSKTNVCDFPSRPTGHHTLCGLISVTQLLTYKSFS